MRHPVTRVIIADDEAPARARVRSLLRGRQDVAIVAECETGPETVAAVFAEKPDVLFLDIRMPGLDGIQALQQMPIETRPIVVLTTAYDEYALNAFDLRAVDYLLKPYTDERFEEALGRVTRLVRGDRLAAWASQIPEPTAVALRADTTDATRPNEEPGSAPLENFVVRREGTLTLVPVGDVDWLEASGDHVRLHVAGATHELRATLREVARQLDPRKFVRIHRSYIVQVDRIRELQPFYREDYVVILKDNTRLRLSRGCRPAVQRRLGITSMP